MVETRCDSNCAPSPRIGETARHDQNSASMWGAKRYSMILSCSCCDTDPI